MGVDWLTDEDLDSDDGPAEGPPKRVRLLDYACGTGMMSKVGKDLWRPCQDALC